MLPVIIMSVWSITRIVIGINDEAQFLTNSSDAGHITAYALINTVGVTALSFFTTDINGNFSATSTVIISIDNSEPQISVNITGG